MKPTYDELVKLVESQRKIIARLEKRVAELEERLNLNSKNSSKPPSQDQKENKQQPKGGGVKGHKGYFRKLFSEDQISKRIVSSLKICKHCGCEQLQRKPSQIFQQVELPKIRPIITQIECEKGQCPQCGRNLIAPFPQEYDKTCFGPNIISLIALCSSGYRMSKRTIQSLLQTLCQVEISLGSIPVMERKISEGLKHSYNDLKQKIENRKIAYVDETSFRQHAKTNYVWTATTQNEALLSILPSRGLDSLNQIRPRGHPGITVTDRYQVYRYDKHQYCLAHIQRNFKKFAERKGFDGELGKRACFELREIFLACRLSSKETMRSRVYYRKQRLKGILEEILANGSDSFSRFAERLLDKFPNLFLFTRYPEVECTNNAAERTLRHIVLWRKTSYGTQSAEGSRFLERAISIWMTLKKQGRQIMPYFLQAYRASYHPGVKPPSICLSH